MKTRWWWVFEKPSKGDVQFIWTQWINNDHLQKLSTRKKASKSSLPKIYNKIEGNFNLNEKKTLLKNMREYYNSK